MSRGYNPLSTEDWNKLMRSNVVARVFPKGMAVPGLGGQEFIEPSPEPPTSPTPTPSITPTQTSSPTPTPSITPTQTSSPTPTPSITPTQTITPTSTLTPTPTPTPQPASVSYITNVNNDDDLTTYTFNNTNYGGAGFIVVGISSQANAPQTISSVSIAGVSATQLTFIQGGNDTNANAISSLWGAQITGGTSGNIVITFSGLRRNCSVGLFRVQNLLSTTPTHSFTNTSATDSVNGTLTGLTTSGIIISHSTIDDGNTSCVWTNNTERYDVETGGGIATAASRTSPSGSLTITATYQDSPNVSCVISSISLR
jgi:hypothetical protein